MKNKFALLIVVTLLILSVLGCSSINPFSDSAKSNTASNKSLTDKGVDAVVGEGKIGVPECDEVVDLITAEANNPDDNFVTKAVKATFLNKMKESIRKSVEENKTNKAELAKNCTELKTQLQKYKAEEEKKKAAQ